MKISTQNEYGTLKSVIVGSAKYATWPSNDTAFTESIATSTFDKKLTSGPMPTNIIKEAEQDLDRLAGVLETTGVKVYRPVINQPNWCYAARDILLCVGNKII